MDNTGCARLLGRSCKFILAGATPFSYNLRFRRQPKRSFGIDRNFDQKNIKSARPDAFLMPSPQARYWILTIPHADYLPYKPPTVAYIKGQLELGRGGFLHWQILVLFSTKQRLRGIKSIFGTSAHCEPTRSEAAEEYVWKEDTRVEGTQFELGERPLRRNNAKDWEAIREAARSGRLDDIPADVYVRYFLSCRFSLSFLEITVPSRELLSTIRDLLLLNEKFACIGEGLASASQEGPGQRRVWTLTLKILTPSFGMGTEIMKTWSLMNFVVALTFPIFSDGSTGIQFLLKSKEAQQFLRQKRSGLHLISTRGIGSMR